jgi:tripartite-type tricarboxylate transporter receptor subunit TctC
MRIVRSSLVWGVAAVAAVAGMSGEAQAQAQNYPGKIVKFVVTYPPGGSSDVMARVIAQQLSEYWGQQFIIDSRPGADGSIGMEYTARQPADGYTIVLGNFGPVLAKSLLSKVNYDWRKDFAPVSRTTIAANILVVPTAMPVKNVKELVVLAKRRPGELTYATSGPGSMSHFAGEMFKRLADVNMITVPYKGNALSIADVMGGHIACMFSDAVPAMTNMKSGKLRALAVTSDKRWPPTPELPTLAEEGIKGFAAVNWWGILTPAGVPRPIIDKLNSGVVKALATPSVQSRLMDVGAQAVSSTPEGFAQFMANEAERWGKLVRETNMRID